MLEAHLDNPRTALLAALPVSERQLDVAGVATAVLAGGDGPPLLLLHGPAGNVAHWASVIPQLADRHRVIAPDLPGHGESQATDDPLAWLAALIEATCDSPPVVAGYALGGAIAARFAVQHPDLIDRLVLIDALGLVPFDPEPEFGRALHAFMAEPSPRTHDQLWQQCAFDLETLQGRMKSRWGAFEAYNLDRARTPSVTAALGTLMERFGMPAIDGLERITVPVALIWGRHDRATPLAVAEAASERLGWPLHVIEDCADDPPIEQPEAFVRALDAETLRERIDGRVLLPGADGFDAATLLWNGMIAKTPALVVQPAGSADVVAALALARENELALSVRGGGHNIAGTALTDGGLTIDMSLLRDVVVDPVARTATVQPGCLLGDVDRAAQEHGLATPLGFFSVVGAAGLTLGGGLGYLTRRFGWTVDNLLEVEIVTADGSVRRASRDENEDLFWAVRGAGANLGVVTSFTYRLHPVGPTVFGGLIAWPFERAHEILRAYRALTSAAPRELAAWMLLFRAPPAPFVPPDWHGERICAMPLCFSGDLAAAEEAIAPIRALGEPVFDLLGEQPYTQLQSYLDDTEPKGAHYYWRTEYVAELGDDLLDLCQELAGECPIPHAEVGFLHVGGALNERPTDDGAVGNRDARFACGVIAGWEPGEPEAASFEQWVRDAGERVRPHSTGGNYVNFQTADEDATRVRASYGANYDRLAAIKRRYDPGNLFRSNRNVPPAGG
ncbi:MAG TPA: alpha/beta fold hydrolase [Solirubrobacteraceae bacterium]|nr:alpha/beta fold hydrolase [Solirubrobacteraceae bacterium]